MQQQAISLDPVCGMGVDPDQAAGSAVHAGRLYHFCSTACLNKFEADPARYVTVDAGAGPATAQTPARHGLPRGGLVLVAFLAIGGFFLLTEHRAHVFGFLPYLLVLACPLMHLFHHGGHGGHHGHGRDDRRPGA
jgi:YHS domain-containing protein